MDQVMLNLQLKLLVSMSVYISFSYCTLIIKFKNNIYKKYKTQTWSVDFLYNAHHKMQSNFQSYVVKSAEYRYHFETESLTFQIDQRMELKTIFPLVLWVGDLQYKVNIK